MIRKNATGYSYQDLSIIPNEITNIESRQDVMPYYESEKMTDELWYSLGGQELMNKENGRKYLLPIFAAPMGCVVDDSNYEYFLSQGIRGVLPTTIQVEKRLKYLRYGMWTSFSVSEVKQYIKGKLNALFSDHTKKYRLCIDCANGHMKSLLELCKALKEESGTDNWKLEIMTGNIANPDVIQSYCKAGIDYVRVGIGGGSECITATQTGVFWPLASLVHECVYYAGFYNSKYNTDLKIIADGGIKNYSDVCKALALGANYVMIGGLFTQCLESCTEVYKFNGFVRTYEKTDDLNIIKQCNDEKKKREILPSLMGMKHLAYGMSSKLAQQRRGLETMKTSEGKENYVDIKYTLKQWTDNMDSYLRSAMSYTDSENLELFTDGTIQMVVNSPTVQNVINH